MNLCNFLSLKFGVRRRYKHWKTIFKGECMKLLFWFLKMWTLITFGDDRGWTMGFNVSGVNIYINGRKVLKQTDSFNHIVFVKETK
jgi:hypothetical protein